MLQPPTTQEREKRESTHEIQTAWNHWNLSVITTQTTTIVHSSTTLCRREPDSTLGGSTQRWLGMRFLCIPTGNICQVNGTIWPVVATFALQCAIGLHPISVVKIPLLFSTHPHVSEGQVKGTRLERYLSLCPAVDLDKRPSLHQRHLNRWLSSARVVA